MSRSCDRCGWPTPIAATLERHPANRVWHLKRLPMMHREGYTGNKSTSNVPHSLIVWDRTANHIEPPHRVRWPEIWADYERPRARPGVSAGDDLALTPEERAALIALLKRTIEYDRFPMAPRLDPLKAILAKLDPQPPPPERLPPIKAGMTPRRGRGGRRWRG